MSKPKNKFAATHYFEYLGLDKVLGAQNPKSKELGVEAHDETLFIIVHQVYELWFKQINHELVSVVKMFQEDRVDERNLGITVGRLERVLKIIHLIIEQIKVMESMTPLDFLEFRSYLIPASGFQSFQFRKMESLLGLETNMRVTYNDKPYTADFGQKEKDLLDYINKGNSLLRVIEKWLERTPFLDFKEFKFVDHYADAVKAMIAKEKSEIENSEFITDDKKAFRVNMLDQSLKYYEIIFDEKTHKEQSGESKGKISYKATIGALLIHLYRDEPILQLPYQLLSKLVDIDEQLTNWRYRHAQMVLRMLGQKIGTGGSSGHEYLLKTATKHQVFLDFHNISTLLIPRSELPTLPDTIKKQLGFYFSKDQ